MNVWIDDYDSAALLVETHHYSKRVPSNIQMSLTWFTDGGLFGHKGEPVAAIIFTIPGTRWSFPVFELARLVRTAACATPLTGLISEACQRIKRSKRMDLLVSFADQTQGHHGGIYQAASWKYAGKRDRTMDGLVVNGTFISGRACNHRFGTRSPSRLSERHPELSILPHYDDGKHLYWRALERSGDQKAVALGLESLSYPKPDKVTA